MRNDDLDQARCRPEFVAAMFEDLRWFGFRWSEGPDVGGPDGPYDQNQRMDRYLEAFERLRAGGFLFPCTCSRQDVLRALAAPHPGEEEPVYPGICRSASPDRPRTGVNWRFRVPQGESVSFIDGANGPHTEIAGREFGDFLVWRKDDLPSYQLACTADDIEMHVTEVVRGADLLTSTCRQLLLYGALGKPAPAFYHCPLLRDEQGQRLAKRHDALSLRTLREQGAAPEELRARWSAA